MFKKIKNLTIYTLVICMLAGCGKAQQESVVDSADTADASNTLETVDVTATDDTAASDVVTPSDDTASDTAFYVYEPNIIDDNYRNYYEIFVGSYYDSDGDGCGDLNGITEKLDYISELGCNGIWLTPIMSAPSYHKYDTTDYYSVDPSFGTNEDFRTLADACHERGIKLIIDLVINHSSSEHPWFTEACEYLKESGYKTPDISECPYVDYYHFTREPMNSSYCEVPDTQWYYEAVFNYTQPDLNLDSEALRAKLEDIAAFWIDLGCDGFRMDAAMHYDDSSSSFNIGFLHDYYEYCRSLDPDFYMVSEVWAAEPVIASYYESGTPSFFNFDAADAEGILIRAGRGKYSSEKFVLSCLDYQETYGATNPDYIDAPFITNHDMGRVANAVMSDIPSLKMTAGLLLTMSGSPFIYYGEEIGMKSQGSADENKRLHMNWSLTDSAGICDDPIGADTDIEQKLPPVDEQESDPDSLLSYYKEALSIRNAYPEIARGEIEIVDELTDGDVAVITKTWDGEEIAIVYNTSDTPAELDLSDTPADGMTLVGELNAYSDSASTSTVISNHAALSDDGLLTVPARSILFLK